MCFDSEAIAQLQESDWVRTVLYRKIVGSTNDLALRRACDDSIKLPLLVLADQQTTGRGRGANQWWSPRGALTFSVVIGTDEFAHPVDATAPQLQGFDAKPCTDRRDRALASTCPGAIGAPDALRLLGPLSLAAGLAVCEALQQLRPALAIGLKWPNDVLVLDRKIAGILVEAVRNRPDRIVIGIGINVNNTQRDFPAALSPSAIALVDVAQFSFALIDVLTRVLWQLREQLRQVLFGRGELIARWRTLCVLTGKRVQVSAGSHVFTGLCRGVDDDGALILDTAQGRQLCNSGSVVSYSEP